MVKNDFIYLIDQSKILKTDLIYIIGNTAYGTDFNFFTLKSIVIDNPLNCCICCSLNEANTINKKLQNTEEEIADFGQYIPLEGEVFNIINNSFIGKFNNLIQNVLMLMTTNPIKIHEDNIRNDENFERLFSFKSVDGTYIYRKDGYIISLYTNLIGMNKADKVSFDLYDINDFSFLVNFRVQRTAKKIINIYIMYRKG